MPDEKLTNIKDINKNTGDNQKLIRVKAKKGMTTNKGRSQWGRNEHQRLKPRKNTISTGAIKEQMLKSLRNWTTKTGSIKIITKRSKTSSSIKDSMCNLPGEINNLTVSVKKEKSPPRSRPTKDTERRKELHDTMSRTSVFRQQILIAKFG